MSDLQPIRVKEVKDHLVVLYGGVSLFKVSKSTLKVFLADLGPGQSVSVTKEKTSRKKRKSKVSVASETITCAKQFVRAYTERKRKFFHSKAVNSISSNSLDFKYFIEAISTVKRHKVSYKKYLEAQIAGLSFVGDGAGVFPSPSQLASEMAETRLLSYLREHGGSKEIPMVRITKEERNTNLLHNSKYLVAHQSVKDKIATLEETVYVRELQVIRKGKATKVVEKYLERFTQ